MNNDKITIDEHVRAALDNFAQPYNAEHWQAMTARLDELDAGDAAFDASFDATIRGRLADVSAVPMADAWSKMAEQLDDLDAEDVSFDNALRGRLADVAAVSALGDWSKMAEKLDSFDNSDADFDEIMRKKLENIAGKHPNHWAMMNERLDREFTLKGKILRYKVMEAALMLLAFFTVLNVIEFNTEGSFEIQKETVNSAIPQISNNKINGETVNPATLNSASPQGQTTKAATFNSGLPTQTNSVPSFDNSTNWRLRGGIQNGQNGGQNGQGVPQNSLQNAQPSQPNLTPTGQPIVDNSVPNAAQKAVYTEGSLFENANSQKGEGEGIETVSANKSVAEVVAPIDILQANLLKNNDLDAPITIIKPIADKKGKWRLSAFGTAALDWVTTSFVYNREQHFQKQGVPNAGINALVAYKRGKVEVETGIMVNQKKYSIANVEYTSLAAFRGASITEKPQDLRLSIVSIPLNVNVQLKDTRRWNVYAHTGIATNAVVDALDRRLIETQNTSSNSNVPPPTPIDAEFASYSKGLINGGETKDNVYLTGHIGVGVEYKLTPKTSLFLQPTANFMLNKKDGIGTLNDRLRTYSIQGGAKWRL
jgi:hypothetical protein